MAEEGYIKLYRQIRHNWIWENPDYLRAWLDLLLSASHDEYKTIYKGEVKTLERGTVHRSFSSLALAWGWSRKRVRNFIRLLEKDGMVSTKVSTTDTVITLVNYSFFQADKKKRNSKGTNESTNEGSNEGSNEGTTNKNVKNVKNVNKSSSGRNKTFSERMAERDEAIRRWAEEDDEDGEEE